MKKNSTQHQELKRIEASESYAELASYREPAHWTNLTDEDRELLAQLFVREGKRLMLEDVSKGLESFDTAERLAPTSAFILLEIGLAMVSSTDHTILSRAHEKFAAALKLDPNHLKALHADGEVLIHLGEHYHELGYLKEAERCLQKAITLSQEQQLSPSIDLLRSAGDCWSAMGHQCGEAYDFYRAIDLYRLALREDDKNAQLWMRYGQAVETLSRLVGTPELVREAIDSYCQALAVDPKLVDAHLHLASLNLRLFLEKGDLSAYTNAEQSFNVIIELHPKQVDAWLGLALLHTRRGERSRDVDLMKDALVKFQKADECEPNHPGILSHWGEALVILGSPTENLSLLREGTAKVMRALELESDNAHFWRIYASCLVELGNYFNDDSYLLEALEKTKIGLRHDDNNPMLWTMLARIYTSLGFTRNDSSMLEEALKYFAKAAELYEVDTPALYNEWGVCLMRLAEATYERPHIEAAVAKFQKAVHEHDGTIDGEIDPEWLYNYGCSLDFLGDFTNNPSCYERAIQVLSFLLQEDPSFRNARYNLGLALTHLGELTLEVEFFERAIEHFDQLLQDDNEDDSVWNELGMSFANLSQLLADPVHPERAEHYSNLAESRLQQAIALGNTQAFYNLACLYSLNEKFDLAMHCLERAEAVNALPFLEDILHDDWLENLKHTEQFRHFAQQLSHRQKPKT